MSTLLTERQYAIIHMLYKDKWTPAEVGIEFGITARRVRQIQIECLELLRSQKNLVIDFRN